MLLAKRVTGEEEVPEGCVAVVTPDAPDVLSHVSVRARNMRVLFAICHEEQPLKDIEALNGKVCASLVATMPPLQKAMLGGLEEHLGPSHSPGDNMHVSTCHLNICLEGLINQVSRNLSAQLQNSIRLPER